MSTMKIETKMVMINVWSTVNIGELLT